MDGEKSSGILQAQKKGIQIKTGKGFKNQDCLQT